jgi:hypothetical protein
MAEYQFTLATIEMGARTYIPTLGRFTRVDPTDGGNENAYVYPPDPVNDFDLDGNMKNGWLNGLAIAGGIAGAIACGASVVCGVAVGIGAGVAAYATSTDHITKGGIIKAAVVGGALASIGGVLTKLPVNRIKIPLGGGNKAILGSAGRRVGGIALHIHDADGKPLLLVVDAMNIVLFRLRETEKTAYEAVSPKGSEYPRWMFEKDGETIIRCVTFGVGGKATGLPKQFDEEATLEISEDVESVQSDYAAFEHAWNQSR